MVTLGLSKENLIASAEKSFNRFATEENIYRAIKKCDSTDINSISLSLLTYFSQVIIPAVIVEVINENNRQISKQIAALLYSRKDNSE